MVKMNETRKKDILRLIRNTKGRFFSLVAIIIIGVAFFVGVAGSSYIMGKNVDRYVDDTNLKDITVYSNKGFDEEDYDAFSSLLKKNNYNVETASLLNEEIPDDTSIAVIYAPNRDYDNDAINKLNKFYSYLKDYKNIKTDKICNELNINEKKAQRYMNELNSIYHNIGYDYSLNEWYFIW